MVRFSFCLLLTGAFAGLLTAADWDKKKKAEYEAVVNKGLQWLKENQAPDGHWSGPGNSHPSTMTAVAGMAMLMEGSNLREGKYSQNIVKATEWMVANAQPNGQLGPSNQQTTYEQGFGMLFLASVYGDEEDKEKRKKLEAILKKAVKLAGDGQSKSGGWFYNLGDGQDEGSTTITVLQGLRAARNAGIPVPKEIIDKATKYLKDCTTPRGGVIYSFASGVQAGGERPPITAAAVACAFSAGQYEDEHAKKWIKFCHDNIPIQRGQNGMDEYQNYYYAQAVYMLGEDKYGQLFPNDKNPLTWSHYRETTYPQIKGMQLQNGSWNGSHGGGVFTTGVNLCILQLDKNIVPIYMR